MSGKFVHRSLVTDLEGSRKVEIRGLGDKQRMTVLLSITISEKVLPPQLLYSGKTARCHPTEAQFPSDWYVTHTTNHWSNETSMLEFAEKNLTSLCE